MSEERKLVTILFADVTGSTALGDMLDPEDVRALMGRYYTHARRIITEHGGTLEKFIGDAVMAVFGLPQAHGDDAERALASALALQATLIDDEMLGPSFLLRIGVNTGEVIAASDPSGGDFLVTGDAVNVASRLQQYAQPGEIIVGERTMYAAQQSFLFEAARLIELRGKRQPLQVFPLKGKRSMRKVERPPLVGRRQDLLQLALLQARTLEEQRPQLVSIIAPAGTGKTRLLEEFLKRLDPADGFQVAIARCLPYGQTLTYWPLRGLLTGLLGSEISREPVRAAFEHGDYSMNDAARLADLVLTTLGIESESATTDRESIFMAWRMLIETLAHQAPRIIIFEDLHWASDSLLDLVEYITHLRTQASLLLISLSRPELLDRRSTWGAGRQNFTSLTLQPLTPAQTRDLVHGLLKDIPEATREQIVERSGGNPFFTLELVRGLSEHDVTATSTTLDTLPDTIHAAVLARLDQLSRKERAVLQIASVASRVFTRPMLAEILDEYPFDEIKAVVNELIDRDMIIKVGNASYAFRHILIRDVTYGTLSRAERMRLHEKLAQFLENQAGAHLDEYVELIAYHYREVARLSQQSAVRSAFPIASERALSFLRRAAMLAAGAGAYAEAHAYLQSAIAIAPASELAALYEQSGDNQWWTITAAESYQQALSYWRKNTLARPDPLTGARLLRKLLIHYTRGGLRDFLGSEPIASWRTEALQLAEQAGDEDELWRIRLADLFSQGSITTPERLSLEEQAALQKLGETTIAYFERKKDWTELSEALDGYSYFFIVMGDYATALTIAKRRLTIPDLPAHEYGDALHVLVRAYAHLGDYDKCIAATRQALHDLRPGQPIIHLIQIISNAIEAAYTYGYWSDSDAFIPLLDAAQEQSRYDERTEIVVLGGNFHVLLIALAREDQARINATTAALQRIVAILPRNTFTASLQALITALLADSTQEIVRAATNSTIPAHSRFLLTLCNQYDLPVTENLIMQTRNSPWYKKENVATIEIAQARMDQDYERLARAIDDLDALKLVVYAARMRIVLAQHTGDRQQLQRARPVLERLEDRQFLRRLEEVEASLMQ